MYVMALTLFNRSRKLAALGSGEHPYIFDSIYSIIVDDMP
jgi:hypothetical protein